jgi:hypothetical protein
MLSSEAGLEKMPPHCDTRDGPVVKAAMKALDTGNIHYILIWIPEDSENELKFVFDKALRARKSGKDAQEAADDWFFETAIRLHRAGEGAPYTGLKPAGQDEGPVVPKAERAIETGDPEQVIRFITKTVEDDLKNRFHHVLLTRNYDVDDVAAGRTYVKAFIGFVVHSHHLYQYVTEGGAYGQKGSGNHH